MGYAADWLSTDQIPRRAVASGQIGRFDLIDPGPRGDTERYSLSGRWHRGNDRALTQASGYLLYYDFGLFSNITYFLDDAEDGDQFEQADRRWVAGFDSSRSWLASWSGRSIEVSAGVEARYDDINNGLFRTRQLLRTATVRQDAVQQLHAGAWADAAIQWHDKVRTRFGLRADVVTPDVASDLAVNSSTGSDSLLSPKLSLILGPWRSAKSWATEVYVNLGSGYHSNDARGAVIAVDPTSGALATPVEFLVRARGADLGLRTVPLPGLHTTLTVFALELDSELVFVGDGGSTEASRPSRRLGVEWTNFYRLSPRLSLDLDLTLTDAVFTNDAPEGDQIPGAIGTTVAAGLSLDQIGSLFGGSFFGALRWRHFGDVPLIEDGSVSWGSSSLVNARIGYRFQGGVDLALDVFNLLDAEASDIEYYYPSRLPGEPSTGVEDVHFHPPRTSLRPTGPYLASMKIRSVSGVGPGKGPLLGGAIVLECDLRHLDGAGHARLAGMAIR